MKTIKAYLTIVLLVFAVVCVSVGLTAVNKTTATAPATDFRVLDGAEIRLTNDENGCYGIRFSAYVGDDATQTPIENATYKMMIVPSDLIELWKSSGSEKNVVSYIKDYATERGGSVAEMTCVPDGNGVIRLSMTDVNWVNLNREFSAVAYYEKNGELTIAELAADGKRSVVDVAKNAMNVDGNSFTDEEKSIINGFIADGDEQSRNIVVSSEREPSFISVHDGVYQHASTVESVQTHKGDAWKISVTKADGDGLQLKLNSRLLEKRLRGYDTVEFSVLSGGLDGNLYLSTDNLDGLVNVSDLKGGAWADITVSAKDLFSSDSVLITGCAVGDYLVTDFKAYKASENAARVSDLIAALDETNLNADRLSLARNAYNALTDRARTFVTGYQKLLSLEAMQVNELIAKIPADVNAITELDIATVNRAFTLYGGLNDDAKKMVSDLDVLNEAKITVDLRYRVINDTSSAEGFTQIGGFGGTLAGRDLTIGYEDKYGNYLSFGNTVAKCDEYNAEHIQLNYPKPSVIADELASCDFVYFYVYNPRSEDVYMFNDIVTGGEGYDVTSVLLKAGDWTKVCVTKEQFLAGSFIGISNACDGVYEYKLGMIYATVKGYEANAVKASISKLPSIDELDGYHYSAIKAARKAYDALSETGKAAVDNYEVLTSLEKAYEDKYVVIYDMESTVPFTIYQKLSKNLSHDFELLTDEAYGSYLSVNIHADSEAARFALNYDKTNLDALLENCDEVCFYVYNGSNEDRRLLASFKGSSGGKYGDTLVSNSWTKISVGKDTFVEKTYFGIYSISKQTVAEYGFSVIWATKAAS